MSGAITGKVLAPPADLDRVAETVAIERSLEKPNEVSWLQVAWKDTPRGRRPTQWVGYALGAKVAVVTWTWRRFGRDKNRKGKGGYTLFVLGRRVGFYATSDKARDEAALELGDAAFALIDLFGYMGVDYEEFYRAHEPIAKAVAYGVAALATWGSMVWWEEREKRAAKAKYVLTLPTNQARIRRFNTLWCCLHREGQ